jgi:ABC-type multidrug transport system fused ATPase/permease subunit
MNTTNNDTSPAIEFRNVFLRFDDQPALVDVSFKLERGEVIILTGIAG